MTHANQAENTSAAYAAYHASQDGHTHVTTAGGRIALDVWAPYGKRAGHHVVFVYQADAGTITEEVPWYPGQRAPEFTGVWPLTTDQPENAGRAAAWLEGYPAPDEAPDLQPEAADAAAMLNTWTFAGPADADALAARELERRGCPPMAGGSEDAAPTMRRGHVITENRPSHISHYELNDHLTRWPITSDGPGRMERFIDRERIARMRHNTDHPYEVWHSGGDPSGCAALVGTARTFKEAIAIAKTRPLPLR